MSARQTLAVCREQILSHRKMAASLCQLLLLSPNMIHPVNESLSGAVLCLQHTTNMWKELQRKEERGSKLENEMERNRKRARGRDGELSAQNFLTISFLQA